MIIERLLISMKNYLNLIKNYSPIFLLNSLVSEAKRKIWQENILGSYSQNYEDLEIEKILKNRKSGRYLEIGAYHPKRLSNTYRFYKNGWTGVVIEPNPEIKGLFLKLRPKDQFLNIGISDKNGSLDYYQFIIPALNTLSKKEAENNQKNGHKLLKIRNIPTRKIEDIVDENFDFISIDTEGFDAMILKGWPWSKFKPKVICVETDKNTVNQILEEQGYLLVVRNQFNSIYRWGKSIS